MWKFNEMFFIVPPTKHCDSVEPLEEYFLLLMADSNIKVHHLSDPSQTSKSEKNDSYENCMQLCFDWLFCGPDLNHVQG